MSKNSGSNQPIYLKFGITIYPFKTVGDKKSIKKSAYSFTIVKKFEKVRKLQKKKIDIFLSFEGVPSIMAFVLIKNLSFFVFRRPEERKW